MKKVSASAAARSTKRSVAKHDRAREASALVKLEAPGVGLCVGEAADVAHLVRPIVHSEQETFVVLCLSVRNVLLDMPAIVAMGTAYTVDVHPRDVFRQAIRVNAAGIVVAHNHPSGDPTPSAEDIELTRRLVAVGDLLGIPVVDHVVVGADCHVSIAQEWPQIHTKS